MDSILNSIKKLLGIDSEDKNFDIDIILHINSAFSRLHRLGVGPATCFNIYDENQIWDDFIPEDDRFNDVKTYIYLKVKMVFDPPLSSFVLSAYQEQIKELEWNLNVTAESTLEDNEDDE